MQATERISATKWIYWRAVLTLAAKDVVEALKNKTTLTMILGLALMMLTVQALPLLLRLDNRPRVAVYDADRSGVADALRREGAVQVIELRHAEDVAKAARETSGTLVAVTLPPGWSAGTGPLTIAGNAAHWLSAAAVADAAAQAEAAFTAVANRPVTISVATVYPTPESGGHTAMVALGLALVIILITGILVPYLLLEEKSAHTLEVLRVSPVSVTQILLGKGIAGMVYGVLAAAVLLAFNARMVTAWDIMLLAVLAGALLGVGLGLLVGILAENEGAVQMWVGLLAVVVMFPLLLALVDGSRVPGWAASLLAWLPGTAMFDLFRLSFGNVWPVGEVAAKTAVILAAALLVYAITGWRLHRWERV